jgi:type 1 glutamine amidotransferase
MKKTLLLALVLILTAVSLPAAHIVMMIGEDEYKTWETLPDFAAKELKTAGHRVTIIHADAADKNQFPGLIEALRDADLLVLSVRRRTPVKEQLDAVRAHLAAGKPLVGIRTASHAFALRPKDTLTDPKLAVWQDFDPEVLGGHYSGHHGKERVAVALAPGAEKHPILDGVTVANLFGAYGLYKVSPLEKDTTPLLLGTIAGQPAEPVAWTRHFGEKRARIFYTSLGAADDFTLPDFRRFLTNAVMWALEK